MRRMFSGASSIGTLKEPPYRQFGSFDVWCWAVSPISLGMCTKCGSVHRALLNAAPFIVVRSCSGWRDGSEQLWNVPRACARQRVLSGPKKVVSCLGLVENRCEGNSMEGSDVEPRATQLTLVHPYRRRHNDNSTEQQNKSKGQADPARW